MNMKIIHFADLHLGVESYGKTDPITGLSSRLNDFLKVFDELVLYSIENKVDLVVFCGDAYRSRDPSQTQQREFARRINQLSANNIKVFLLVGNHDMPNAFGKATSMEIFNTLDIKNVQVANSPGTYRIDTKNGTLQIVALPWARRSALLSREEARALTIKQLNDKIQQIISGIITSEISNLNPDIPAILAGHTFVSTAKLGTEKAMTLGNEYSLLHSEVARPEFDYIALGHVHKHQILSNYPLTAYAGSLERIDFSDEDEEKGFYVLELDNNKSRGERIVSFEFHPVQSRRFLTITIDANTDNPTTTIIEDIKKYNISDAIVRVIIKVSESKAYLIQESEIRKILNNAYYIGSIVHDIDRERRVRIGTKTAEQMSPIKALSLYLETKNTPAEYTSKIIEYGKRLISEDHSSD